MTGFDLNRAESGKAFKDQRGLASLILSVVLACLIASPYALAQVSGNTLGLANQDSKKPIDIESDRLEVDDKSQTAIFIGKVSATQGDHNLRSDRLEVIYERASQQQQNGQEKPAKTQNAGAGGDGTGQQIKNITAIGNVVVTSLTDGQTGSGDRGFFDVKAQKVILWVEKTGNPNHCVVLSQKGGNVVRGAKVIMYLSSGRTDVEPCQSRVSTILIPGSNNMPSGGKTQNGGAATKKKPDTTSGTSP